MVPVKRYSLCRVKLTALHKQITSDNNNKKKTKTTTSTKTKQQQKQKHKRGNKSKRTTCLSRQTCVGRDKTFVATNICRNIILPQQKFSHALFCFVARKLYLTRQYLS